jgi:hypothetical protein
MHLVLALLLASALLSTGPVLAHGGGLNAEGCHTNRKTGDYHCHRGPAPARASGRSPYVPSNSLQSSPARTFRNCTEARAAGAAPVRRGDPGWLSFGP